ncbi:MAG: hypothetical protein N3D82_04375 [Ignisphaera sp.]|nr:hypothetical protein [Ignisphaera sp.]MCX8168244.1 hypothetical protein [Ignisphaera sp.]MDW8084888.1 V-type ATP synthase subunit F [Ignisphaera sp.]
MHSRPKSKIAAIVRRELAPLIRILGIDDVFVIENQDEVLATLTKLAEDKSLGVIIIQKSLIKGFDLTTYLQNIQVYPSIIAFPDTPDDISEPPKSFYRDIIRRFIGYEVYLE